MTNYFSDLFYGIVNENRFMFIISFIFAVVFSIFALFFSHSISEKLFKCSAVFLVFIITLLADNPGVYGVSVFIIATMITKLEFLENLAAIVWGRDKFFEMRIGLASTKDIKENLEAEENQLLTGIQKVLKPKNIREDIINFENTVLYNLLNEKLFLQVKNELALKVENRSYFVDALGLTSDKDFFIEIKMTDRTGIILSSINKLKEIMSIYSQNNKYFLLGRDFKGILVVKSTSKVDDIINGVFVLKFDEQQNKFINIEKLKEFIL